MFLSNEWFSYFKDLVGGTASRTLQREDGVSVDHDAQLQNKLWGWLQEGLQEAEHGDVSALKHQPPVEVAAGPVAVPAALGAQVEGVDVPEDDRETFRASINYKDLPDETSTQIHISKTSSRQKQPTAGDGSSTHVQEE